MNCLLSINFSVKQFKLARARRTPKCNTDLKIRCTSILNTKALMMPGSITKLYINGKQNFYGYVLEAEKGLVKNEFGSHYWTGGSLV